MLFVGLIVIAAIKPKRVLCDFDTKSTAPLRGILAVLIIFHHISQRYDFSECIGPLHISPIYYFQSMGAPIVAVFFFLTGYGLMKSLQIKGKMYLKGFIPRRLGKILPEFIILTLGMVFILEYNGHPTIETIERMKSGNPPLPFSWFMYVIVYVYLSFYLSAKLSRCNLALTEIGFIVLMVLNIIIVRVLGWGSWWSVSTPSVVLGSCIALYEKRITNILFQPLVLWILVLSAVSLVLFMPHIPVGVFVAIQLMALLVYMCMRLYGMKAYPILIWLGGISLNIYLIHGIILKGLTIFELNGYLALFLTIIISSLCAYAMKYLRSFLENKSNQLFSKERVELKL